MTHQVRNPLDPKNPYSYLSLPDKWYYLYEELSDNQKKAFLSIGDTNRQFYYDQYVKEHGGEQALWNRWRGTDYEHNGSFQNLTPGKAAGGGGGGTKYGPVLPVDPIKPSPPPLLPINPINPLRPIEPIEPPATPPANAQMYAMIIAGAALLLAVGAIYYLRG